METVIKANEVNTLKASYEKMMKLKKEFEKAEAEFSKKEVVFLTKYKKGYKVSSNAPKFIVEEWSRRIISWKWVMEKICGKEVTETVLQNTVPTRYSSVRF